MPGGGAGRRRFRAWGLLAVAGLVAGIVGLASLPNAAEGQGAPNAPTGFAASSVTGTTAALSWTAGAAGGCPATKYIVRVTVFATGTIVWQRTNVTATTVTATGLSTGTKYRALVFAYSDDCLQYSAQVPVTFTTTGSATTDPDAPTPEPTVVSPNPPTGFAVSSVTGTTAVLSWTAGADGDCPTEKYHVGVTVFATGAIAWQRNNVTATTVTATGLKVSTKYRAFISAYGRVCNYRTPQQFAAFTTGAVAPTNTPTPAPTVASPNAPTGFAASSITSTTAVLSWTAGADGGCAATKYHVKVQLPSVVDDQTPDEVVWEQLDVTATTVTATGLSRATAYEASVLTYGRSCDNYAPRLSIKFTTTGAPLPPAGVMATGGVRQATLTWTDPGDATITSWEYQQKEGTGNYGAWTAIGSSSATTTRHTVTGLTAGTVYAFKVRAVNPAGNGAASGEVTAATAPAKPTGVTAAGGVKRATLNWTNPSYASITSWEYQQKAGAGSYGTWTAIGSSSATTTSHTVTGLTDGTVYAFKVRAVNPAGNGDASDEVTATTVPAKPTGVTAAGGVKRVTLSWANPSDASITSWEYQQKQGSGSYGTWTAIPSSSATTTTYAVTGLTDATSYAFKVRAVNPGGNGDASDEVTATTVPAKPTGVTATAGAQRVTLAWADPGDATITRWEYQQKQGSGSYGTWTAIPGSSATTTTYTVRSLLAETAYGFKVRAVNASGNSPASDEVTATTPMFVLVPGETTATPPAGAGATPTGTPTPTSTATPTPPPAATPTPTPPPETTPTATATPSATPDTDAGDTDDDEPTEPDVGDGDMDDDEPAEPDIGAGDMDDDEPAEPDTGDGDRADDNIPEPDTDAGGDTGAGEPGIGDAGSGLATGGVSLAAISGVIALALALALGGPVWARRRR